eukprot:2150271-Lingulodinium_polyedra.AAC.1
MRGYGGDSQAFHPGPESRNQRRLIPCARAVHVNVDVATDDQVACRRSERRKFREHLLLMVGREIKAQVRRSGAGG